MNGQSHWYYFLNALAGFAFFAIIAMAFQLAYWLFYPYQTAEVIVPIEIVNESNQVPQGGGVKMIIFFDKRTDVQPTVSRNIICTGGLTYSVTAPANRSTSRPRGDGQTSVTSFALPEETSAGEVCVFEFQNSYQMNPVRTIIKTWQSEPFEVVEAQ